MTKTKISTKDNASLNLPLVTVIVLNWNGKRFIDSFFNSIYKQDYPQECIEILFIDNNSTDDSVDYFLSKNYPNSRYIQTGANYGYAGGNNYGLREAKGDYIAVCNNDLVLEKKWLSNLVVAAKETKADVIVPKLVYANSKKINNAGSILQTESDWPNKERGMGKDMNDPNFNSRTEITAFCGASPLFKRSFLKDVGLFDKRFFLYWEDGDLSWRGQKAGKHYIYEPKAVAYHNTSGSTGGESSKTFIYYVSRNRVLVLLKNGRLNLALRAYLKVFRDHVIYKSWDLAKSLRRGIGRREAIANLKLGVKIVYGVLMLTPVCLLKRAHILKEETL